MEKEEKAFRKLIVWKRAHVMTLAIYKASEKNPRHEIFGLTSQLRRSAGSNGANIAEGYALGSSTNYLYHLNIAVGSQAETEYHLELAHDLCYLTEDEFAQLCGWLTRSVNFSPVLRPPSREIHLRYLRNHRNLNNLWSLHANKEHHPHHRF